MKRSGQTVLWELWAALCLCTALVLPPGSPWLHEPALLYPGPFAGGSRARRVGDVVDGGAAAAVAAGAAAGTGTAAEASFIASPPTVIAILSTG